MNCLSLHCFADPDGSEGLWARCFSLCSGTNPSPTHTLKASGHSLSVKAGGSPSLFGRHFQLLFIGLGAKRVCGEKTC